MTTNGNNGTSKKRERTAARIIAAVKETRGLLTYAASKAGVSYTTINRYVKDFSSVAEAVQEAKEGLLDFAESKLVENITSGKEASIFFFLKTQGKARGYIERQEVANPPGEAFRIEHDAKKKLLDELNRFTARTGAKEGDKQT